MIQKAFHSFHLAGGCFMVFSDFHFYSEVLGIQTAAYILLPQPQVAAQSGSPIPVLYLLHGLSDDHTMWLRQTRVEQYAQRYRLAVVMPAANRSFYMDMAHGAKYETFVSRELPSVIEPLLSRLSQAQRALHCRPFDGRLRRAAGWRCAIRDAMRRPPAFPAVWKWNGAMRPSAVRIPPFWRNWTTSMAASGKLLRRPAAVRPGRPFPQGTATRAPHVYSLRHGGFSF